MVTLPGVKVNCEDVILKRGSVTDIITCAKDLMNLFVQLNWTGPPVDIAEQLESVVGGSGFLPQLNKECLDKLTWDGEVSAIV